MEQLLYSNDLSSGQKLMAVAACIKGFNYFPAGGGHAGCGGQRQLGRDTPADKSGKICCNSSRDASNLLYLSLCTKVLCKGRYAGGS